MTFDRRSLLAAATACALAFGAGAALAQDKPYPSETIHLITGFPPGSGSDVLVRYLGKELGDLAGTTVIVENKTGAAGNIGAEYVAKSKPDGYTVYVHAASSIAANMHLFKNPPIDVARDLQIAATINQQAFMLIVPASSPYKSVQELVKGMEEKGDTGNYAISNTTGRVMGRLFVDATGIRTEAVSYQTDLDVVNDMKSGTIDFAMMNPVFSLAQARAGEARILAVSTPERLKAAPEYPTFGEAGYPSLVMLSWFAAIVPSATPKPVVDKLNGYFNEILARPATEKFLNENGGDPFISTPEEGQALLVQQIEDWKGYVQAAGIEPQ
jgi:tripartite-type tricarboxylate transporter receptor subunit TctC